MQQGTFCCPPGHDPLPLPAVMPTFTPPALAASPPPVHSLIIAGPPASSPPPVHSPEVARPPPSPLKLVSQPTQALPPSHTAGTKGNTATYSGVHTISLKLVIYLASVKAVNLKKSQSELNDSSNMQVQGRWQQALQLPHQAHEGWRTYDISSTFICSNWLSCARIWPKDYSSCPNQGCTSCRQCCR